MHKLTRSQTWAIIVIIGFASFFTCLNNPFIGDDLTQIVDNPAVHSISNIGLFFKNSTFYSGDTNDPFTGAYYRPLMTTVFSLLYTAFGPRPFYFHLLQVLLCIGSAIILYEFFKYSFKPLAALILSLIFLVHPLNSQVAFALPAMQDALFFFFGILALWLLLRFKSKKSLLWVVLSLMFCLFSKEIGVLFVILSTLYLALFDKKRLTPLIFLMILPITLYITMKLHAVGLTVNPHNAPIDNLAFSSRLFTIPSILLFYITKFLVPFKLASAYYWVYPAFSLKHFLLPLLIDGVVLGLLTFLTLHVKKRATHAEWLTYLFFLSWAALGVVVHIQILPLDMTVCETWFHFAMVGVLGALGMSIKVLGLPGWLNKRAAFISILVLIILLGFRTAIHGRDWRSEYILASHNITVSKEDYGSELLVAAELFKQGKYDEARYHAQRSVDIYPEGANYNMLGVLDVFDKDYVSARQAYLKGLTYSNTPQSKKLLYENAARSMLWAGDPNDDIEFIKEALVIYPQNAKLWLDLAVIEYTHNNQTAAKEAISQAYQYDPNEEVITAREIMTNGRPLILNNR